MFKETYFFSSIGLILLCQASIPEDVESITKIQSSFQFSFDLDLRPNSSSELCNQQLELFQEGLDRNEIWARKLKDAWGRVPSGIFSGNVFDFGNFDQCINFEHQTIETGKILGQHCTVRIPFEREQHTMARITAPTRS